MTSRQSLLILAVILSSFSIYYLPGDLLVYAVVLLALGAAAVEVLLEGRFAFTTAHLPLLVYIAWIALALTIGYRSSLSVATLAFSFGAICITLLTIPLSRWLTASDERLFLICHAVAVLGAVIALIPTLTFVHELVTSGYRFPLTADQLRALGEYGEMLLATSILTIPLLFNNRRYAGSFALQFFALMAVGGRAGMLGVVVALGYYTFLRKSYTRLVKFGTVAGLFALVSLIFLYLATPAVSYLSDTMINDIFSGRIWLWTVGRRTIFNHPILGVGFQNLRSAFGGLYTAVGTPEWIYGKGPHNTFVRIGVALGLPGILIFVSIFLAFYRVMLSQPFDTVRQRFFLAAVTGFLVFGLFESHLIGGASTGSLLLTLFLSAGLWTADSPEDSEPSKVQSASMRSPVRSDD